MRKHPDPSLRSRLRDRSIFDEALRAGGQAALRLHKQAGVPVAVWENGRAILVEADKVDVGPNPVIGDRIAS